MGKVLKPFQEAGILGQIALMYLVPYAGKFIWQGLLKMAPGALAAAGAGTAAGAAAGAGTAAAGVHAGTKFGLEGLKSLGTALTEKGTTNLFQKAVGTIVKGVHAGGQAFQTVTSAIGTGIDNVMEAGRNFFGGDGAEILTTDVSPSIFDPATAETIRATPGEVLAETLSDDAAAEYAQQISAETSQLYLPEAEISAPLITPEAPVITAPTLGEELVTDLKGGLKEGAKATAKAVGVSLLSPQPDDDDDDSYVAGYAVEPVSMAYGPMAYDKQDFMNQSQGNYYGGPTSSLYGQELFGQDPWFQWMNMSA